MAASKKNRKKSQICITNNNWKYCKNTTIKHHLAQNYPETIVNLDELCINEGARTTPFDDELCVNLDDIEKNIASKQGRNRRRTMDFFFGVCNESGEKNKIILCELKLNYKNTNNLRKKELDEKLSNSKVLVGQNPSIHNRYYFIFNTNLKQQAYNNLRRLYSNKSNMIALDLNDLKNMFF